MKKIILLSLLLAASLAGFSQTTRPHCKGIKANGKPCMSTMLNKSGYCHYHDPANVHCAFIKKDKTQCKMIVTEGQKFCRYHGGN
jgi:hypothetical protein